MKKLFLVLTAVIAFAFAANAQDAVGVRFGGGNGYGAELSFLKGVGNTSRLEFDLGINNNADNFFHAVGMYQVSGPIVDKFNWFVGAGAQIGYCQNHGFGLALAGVLGIEFLPSSIPFEFSVDARPTFEFLLPEHCGYHGFGWGACLGIRYMLN